MNLIESIIIVRNRIYQTMKTSTIQKFPGVADVIFLGHLNNKAFKSKDFVLEEKKKQQCLINCYRNIYFLRIGADLRFKDLWTSSSSASGMGIHW